MEVSERAQACYDVGLSAGFETAWGLSAADPTLTRLDAQKRVSSIDFDPSSERMRRGNFSSAPWVVSA